MTTHTFLLSATLTTFAALAIAAGCDPDLDPLEQADTTDPPEHHVEIPGRALIEQVRLDRDTSIEFYEFDDGTISIHESGPVGAPSPVTYFLMNGASPLEIYLATTAAAADAPGAFLDHHAGREIRLMSLPDGFFSPAPFRSHSHGYHEVYQTNCSSSADRNWFTMLRNNLGWKWWWSRYDNKTQTVTSKTPPTRNMVAHICNDGKPDNLSHRKSWWVEVWSGDTLLGTLEQVAVPQQWRRTVHVYNAPTNRIYRAVGTGTGAGGYFRVGITKP